MVRRHVDGGDLDGRDLNGRDLDRCHVDRGDLDRCHVDRGDLDRCHVDRCHVDRGDLDRCHVDGCHLDRGGLAMTDRSDHRAGRSRPSRDGSGLEVMDQPPTTGRERPASATPHRRVNLLTGVVLVPLLLLIAPLFQGAVAFCDKGPWIFVMVTLGFVICEPLVFHIEARNEAVSFSPTDLPLAIGLLMLSPLTLVAARIVGSAILLIGWRRQPLFKFTLNLTAFTTETLVAVAVFR